MSRFLVLSLCPHIHFVSIAFSHTAWLKFNQLMQEMRKRANEEKDENDIASYVALKVYEKSDRLHPALMKAVGKSRKFLDSLLETEEFQRINSLDSRTKCF